MKSLGRFLLIAAICSWPSHLVAEGLPPVWETSDWTDKESLWIDKPDILFVIRGAGSLEGWISDGTTYDIPPAIRLLGDEAFAKALFRDAKAVDSKAVVKEIERKTEEYEKRFADLIRKIWNLEKREERIAEIDAFEYETKALLVELHGRLTPAQRERCERRFASAYFYTYGPIEFARRLGATENELAEIRSRLRELHEPLRTQLRELETATYLEVLGKLEGEGVVAMRKLVASASPRRYGVIHTLHEDLANFDAPPIPMKIGASYQKRNRLSGAGAPLLEQEVPTDPFNDFVYLFSVQDLDARDRELAGAFIGMQFAAGVARDSQVSALKAKASDLERKAHRDKEADQFQLYAERAEVESKIAELLNDDVEAAMRMLSDDGRLAIEAGRFILYMQRYGCTSALSSKYAHGRFGLSITAASWQTLDAASDELAASLRDRAVAVQQEFVKNLYRETSLDKQFEEAWARTADEDYPPLLEMLIVHADATAK